MASRMFMVTTGVLVTLSLAFAFRKWKDRSCSNKKQKSKDQLMSSDSEKLVESTLEEIKKLQKKTTQDFSRIDFRNEDEFRRKLNSMFKDGLQRLQIITDFDRTLSKARHMGKPVPSTHGILELYPELSEETRNKFTDLRTTYMAIEFDPDLPEEEKAPYMQEWWSQSHAEIVRAGVHKNRLNAAVTGAGINLREGAADFLRLSNRLQVPVLIFSAGIGNVIEEILEHNNCTFDNVEVTANYMTFDQQGDLNGFQGQIIHTFNKSAKSCSDTDFCAANLKRRNVILLGDSTGDRSMADGAVDPSQEANVLRVGFLNDKIAESRELYLTHFDIILVDDQTFDVPNVLLRSLGLVDLDGPGGTLT